jgi:polysaccharide deacetylase family protein (PEP-CTERM system associated)
MTTTGKTDTASLPALLTFDVEDWEHANFSQLRGHEAEIATSVRARGYAMDANTDRWIEILAEAGATSTCFVLGEFAQRYPAAVRRLADAGHEIAAHGATHDLIYQMTREQFRDFLRRSLGTVGELTGQPPLGFRAPSWSVDARTPWFCAELAAQGVRYDSSLFPVRTPLYGDAGAALQPHRVDGVLRIPVTVLALGPLRVPFASGAFFRLCPLPVITFGLARAARAGLPAMAVLHPRELDPQHPRLPLRGWEAAVHYARLKSTIPKLRAILRRFRWKAIKEVYGPELGGALTP